MAANDPIGIVPFRQFVDSLQQVQAEQHLALAESRARDTGAVREMHSHLVRHYSGVDAVHSFSDENGSVFDCIPVEQQPALRQQGAAARPATPPDLPPASPDTRAAARAPAVDRPTEHVVQLHPDRQDQYGNVMHAPGGTIPMRRLTMGNLARFETLRHFFQKSPFGSARPPRTYGPASPASPQGGAAPPAAAVAQTHRWAHAAQSVANLGGHSFINVWDPPIGGDQVFSLAQHWYVAGSGDALQTAEVGWQVYPQMYGNTKPAFFIYWTADNYKSLGCYNLNCPAFVQTNNSWAIGGALSPWSTPGGEQQEIEVSFFLSQGNWWLYLGGGAAANAIGYYPGSLYGNGAMASGAAEIDYGGEVVGTTSFPSMGGAAFADQGFRQAAYHRDIRYFPAAGGNVPAVLTAAAASPACYTAVVSQFDPDWNATLFFGGPGGTNC
jgi:hypothetical protein